MPRYGAAVGLDGNEFGRDNWIVDLNMPDGWLLCKVCMLSINKASVYRPNREDHQRIHITHYTFTQTGIEEAMRVDWCDPGDHPFKAGIPGSQQFTGTVVNEEGQSVQQQMSVCPEHSFSSKAKDTAAPELTPRPQV